MVPMFPQHEDLKLLELVLCESQKILLLISVAALGVALYLISNNIVVVDVIFAYDLNIVFPLTNHRLGLEEEINIIEAPETTSRRLSFSLSFMYKCNTDSFT